MKIFEIVDLFDLFEVRTSFKQVKKLLPSWPDYAIKEMVDFKELKTFKEIKEAVEEFEDIFGKNYSIIHWEYKTIKITLDSFDSDTQKLIVKNLENPPSDFMVNAEKRYQNSEELLRRRGKPFGPIIVYVKDGKFSLLEGFHRTVKALKIWPDGYSQPTYIAYPTKIDSRFLNDTPQP